MTNITEITKKLSEKISNAETRKRSRTAEEYQRFLYAIEYILTEIWKSSFIHPEELKHPYLEYVNLPNVL